MTSTLPTLLVLADGTENQLRMLDWILLSVTLVLLF